MVVERSAWLGEVVLLTGCFMVEEGMARVVRRVATINNYLLILPLKHFMIHNVMPPN